MNNFVEESSARTVSVFRGDSELKSGVTFQPGEMLRVHLSDGQLSSSLKKQCVRVALLMLS